MADFNVVDDGRLQALNEFIAMVDVMRQAQEAFEVVSSASHLVKKLDAERMVDQALYNPSSGKPLLTPEISELSKRIIREVSRG